MRIIGLCLGCNLLAGIDSDKRLCNKCLKVVNEDLKVDKEKKELGYEPIKEEDEGTKSLLR